MYTPHFSNGVVILRCGTPNRNDMVLPLITYRSQVHAGGCLGCTLCASLPYVSNSDKLHCLGLSLKTRSYFMPHNPGRRKEGLECREQVWEECEKERKQEVEEKKGENWGSPVMLITCVPGPRVLGVKAKCRAAERHLASGAICLPWHPSWSGLAGWLPGTSPQVLDSRIQVVPFWWLEE